MEDCCVAMEDIVTVGLRYGMKADVVAPLFERKEPIDLEKAVKILGFEEVVLSPVSNPYDIYADGRKVEAQGCRHACKSCHGCWCFE